MRGGGKEGKGKRRGRVGEEITRGMEGKGIGGSKRRKREEKGKERGRKNRGQVDLQLH